MEKLVEKAKTKEESATEEILEKFKYLIFKEATKYHIPSYNYEDLVQHGYLSVLKAISMYKLHPIDRDILMRYYVMDQSLGEIACDSNKTYPELIKLKRRILKKLRTLM